MRKLITAVALLVALGITAGVQIAQEQPKEAPDAPKEAPKEATPPAWVKMPAATLHKDLERNRIALAQQMARCTVSVEIDFDRPASDEPVQQTDAFMRYDLGPFSGLVVANNQVMISDRCLGAFNPKGASEAVLGITVTLPNGARLPAKVTGRYQQIDLALLEVSGDIAKECPDITIVSFPAEEIKLERGQRVTVIGRGQNPLGLLVNTGIVSAIGREAKRAFQLDARIGNSTLGAPVVDTSGKLVGMVTLHNHATFGQASGVSYAAYLHEVREAYAILKEGKFIKAPDRPFMGVGAQPEWNDKPGLRVGNVVGGSGAQQAGIRNGDIILQIDGKDMFEPDDLRDAIMKKKIDDTIKVKILRGEEELEVEVKLGKAP